MLLLPWTAGGIACHRRSDYRVLQVAAKAHAAALAAEERARNATALRAGGYGQGSFPGSVSILDRNRTASGSPLVARSNNVTVIPNSQTSLMRVQPFPPGVRCVHVCGRLRTDI